MGTIVGEKWETIGQLIALTGENTMFSSEETGTFEDSNFNSTIVIVFLGMRYMGTRGYIDVCVCIYITKSSAQNFRKKFFLNARIFRSRKYQFSLIKLQHIEEK